MDSDVLSEWDKEVESLLGLLKEYADKLRVRSAAWLHRSHRLRWLYVCVACLWSFLTWIAFLWLDKNLSYGSQYYQYAAVGSVAMLGGFAVIAISYFMTRRQLLLEASDIGMLVNVVEKLVRRSSQIQDHSPMNFTKEIALDLRLAEAEAALRLAKLV